MGVPAGNIGKARVSVKIIESPFKCRPQQDIGYYFTKDNFSSMGSVKSVVPLPDPTNGYRLEEDLRNYDNHLTDSSGTLLEEAVLTQADSGTSLVDNAAQYRADDANRIRPQDSAEKDFFTWQVAENLFVIDDAGGEGSDAQPSPNPGPKTFAELATRTDNTPKWTYNRKEKPDGARNGSPLTPFMIRTTSSPLYAVHWGCKMRNAIARNQPFEMLFYHDGQVHTLAEEAQSLQPRFQGFDVDLTKRAYFAIETGIGNSTFHYLILFVQGMSPRFYVLSNAEGGLTAQLYSENSAITGEKFFNPENGFFTVKIEPVSSGLLITSNQFETPWAVMGSSKEPLFLGEGPLAVYSGNVQAGFALRPVQYKEEGSFVTPSQNITLLPGDSDEPKATTSIKGGGDSQQARNGEGEVHAVDCELVDGKDVITFIEQDASVDPLPGGKRKITLKVTEIKPADDPPAFGPRSGTVRKKEFNIKVRMWSSNVSQGNGYVVKNGRSPYIWQARMQLDSQPKSSAGSGEDISCDVIGLELNWNATSYNEMAHTGSLRLLNRPRKRKTDYRDLSGRATYLRISAWWENGVGNDPGGQERQVFEGMAIGTTVETKAEKEIVTLKLEDYMSALEGGKFVNSPFYDGMKASKAVVDIVKQLGIPEGRILVGGSNAASLPDDPDEFGLPFANPMEEPMFRFKDGSSYKQAVVRIATLDGKLVYFDNEGNFHYDPVPGGIAFDEDTTPVAAFVSSPRDTTDGSLVVWNSVSFSRAVNDVYNVLQVSTIDKETGVYMTVADVNEGSIFDPTAEGFLGYRKHMFIQEPALGNIAALGKYFDTYRRRIFIPPLTARFETYGRAGLKPMDTITLDGQKLRITNISLRLDSPNDYWMSVEGEWYFSQAKVTR